MYHYTLHIKVPKYLHCSTDCKSTLLIEQVGQDGERELAQDGDKSECRVEQHLSDFNVICHCSFISIVLECSSLVVIVMVFSCFDNSV